MGGGNILTLRLTSSRRRRPAGAVVEGRGQPQSQNFPQKACGPIESLRRIAGGGDAGGVSSSKGDSIGGAGEMSRSDSMGRSAICLNAWPHRLHSAKSGKLTKPHLGHFTDCYRPLYSFPLLGRIIAKGPPGGKPFSRNDLILKGLARGRVGSFRPNSVRLW